MAETIQQKAERLLVEGRLTILSVGPPGTRAAVVAECKGDSGEIYKLGYDADEGAWRCECEASSKFQRRCSHIRALHRVTVKPKGGGE